MQNPEKDIIKYMQIYELKMSRSRKFPSLCNSYQSLIKNYI